MPTSVLACRFLRANQSETPIRCIGPSDCEVYLGTPIGSKLMFRPANQLIPHLMNKVADSLLAPLQKTGGIQESSTSVALPPTSVGACPQGRRKFLDYVAGVPSRATVPFFYADRKVGGLGTFRLGDDANICTIARATQHLTSKDPI